MTKDEIILAFMRACEKARKAAKENSTNETEAAYEKWVNGIDCLNQVLQEGTKVG